MNLKKKFAKMPTRDRTGKFLECLDKMEMAMDGPESSFYDYTREWITKVDRGGLFDVLDNAYVLPMNMLSIGRYMNTWNTPAETTQQL